MNRNPSPKSEFLKSSELIKNHHALLDNPSLQVAIDAALLEMNRQVCNNMPAENMGACAAGHLRMLGAHDFVQIFLNLAEEAAPAAKPLSQNLPSNISNLPGKGR